MNLNKTLKSIDKNYLLLFLIVLVGFVLVDCNTKMFSKLFEGQGGGGDTSGLQESFQNAPNSGSCGKLNGVPTQNPTTTAKNSCNLGAANGSADNNNNGLPQGYAEGTKVYVSATGPLGREVPKTLQGDYSTLKSFGLTNLKDVVNYIPGDGPAQFITGNRTNNNAAGRRVANSNNANSNNTDDKWKVFGSMSCGWTRKHIDHMKKNNIPHDFVNCAENPDQCKDIKGMPTLQKGNGPKKSGYQEV